jgi:hypothetical protein
MELSVDLGPMPADAHCGGIITGLRSLLERSELCDVVLMVGGQNFVAHRAVLAAVSPSFHECLTRLSMDPGAMRLPAHPGSIVLQLDDVTNPEAVRVMLDCVYGPRGGATSTYSPSTEETNRDVLRLAQRFQVALLLEHASRWLTRDLSTSNLLQRLLACEEFGLTDVRERILEQLTANPEALYVLARDPEITKVPAVMQDLLVRILRLLGCETSSKVAPVHPKGGKARKAGA